MKLHVLKREQVLPISPEASWAFFSSPLNLAEITPPEMAFEIVGSPPERMHEGQIIAYEVGVAPGVRVGWVTEIKAVDEGRSFVDEQRSGPYRFWHHRHVFEAIDGVVKMTDLVHYALPLGILGALAHRIYVGRKLKEIFDFRQSALERVFPGSMD